MRSSRKQVGAWGEQLAAEKLRRNGYEILAQNYFTPYGEIDLIARKEGQVIFVEVKTRTSEDFGLPEEAVSERKKEHILQSIDHYLQEHPEIECDWRVDVAAIQRVRGSGEAEIVWFENALA